MKLYGSSRSPYVRKVLIAAHETGTIDDIVLEPVVVSTLTSNHTLLDVTPLSQIPALALDDGSVLYDSAVICRHLDLILGTGALHPRDPAAEIAMMRRLALGDGLIALLMALLSEYSRRQPGHSERRIDVIRHKLPRIFTTLDDDAAAMTRAPFDMAQISIVAALCYLDFRLQEEATWRVRFPALARWFEEIGKRPSVVATTYFDEQALLKAGQAEKTGTT
ncbi:glutathione S-transferase family protein [Arvimicrobium flavum]|uniref:glutathione S-transferase family protein n=1 Tax=Arvimicrobium flavum TaxID=3393320 RepID=UPI00237AFCDB|nr:glutathione S-transferase family protein [Mesorhizobium shangrilense]